MPEFPPSLVSPFLCYSLENASRSELDNQYIPTTSGLNTITSVTKQLAQYLTKSGLVKFGSVFPSFVMLEAPDPTYKECCILNWKPWALIFFYFLIY